MRLLKPLIVSVFQTILFVGLYDLTLFLFERFGYESNSNISWGISVRYGFWVFVVLVIIVNYIKHFRSLNRYETIILISAMIIFCIIWIKDLGYTPYKTSLFLFCALCGFLSRYLFDRLIYKRQN
jgi:UDP-N-acetylmuramyl pentapeptide phosphotransferase/UDP-N-acetylglucosamine-1-phosphate transferase